MLLKTQKEKIKMNKAIEIVMLGIGMFFCFLEDKLIVTEVPKETAVPPVKTVEKIEEGK
jgi:hypothetical protein